MIWFKLLFCQKLIYKYEIIEFYKIKWKINKTDSYVKKYYFRKAIILYN